MKDKSHSHPAQTTGTKQLTKLTFDALRRSDSFPQVDKSRFIQSYVSSQQEYRKLHVFEGRKAQDTWDKEKEPGKFPDEKVLDAGFSTPVLKPRSAKPVQGCEAELSCSSSRASESCVASPHLDAIVKTQSCDFKRSNRMQPTIPKEQTADAETSRDGIKKANRKAEPDTNKSRLRKRERSRDLEREARTFSLERPTEHGSIERPIVYHSQCYRNDAREDATKKPSSTRRHHLYPMAVMKTTSARRSARRLRRKRKRRRRTWVLLLAWL